MEYLDPRSRRLHTIRLMIGYGLMTILIFTATMILVYRAYGFDVDRKTGQVIQNGLVYLDSAPDKASVYINGELQKNRTNTSFLLKEGNYTITLKRDGYRDWNKQIDLRGGDIYRINYPMFFQNDLSTKELTSVGRTDQAFYSQSPDRRWILSSTISRPLVYTQFDLKNLESNNTPVSSVLNFPNEVFTTSDEASIFEVIEWSNDNQHFLVKHSYGQTVEFVMLNRDRPETSFNINKLLGVNPVAITLLDKNFDKWVLTDASGNLTIMDARKNLAQFAKSTTSYKTFNENIIVYSQKSPDGQGQAVYIKQNDTTKLLTKIKTGTVAVDITKYGDHFYVAVASSGDKKTYIYKDPWQRLLKNPGMSIAPLAIFHSKNSDFSGLSFSGNSRYAFVRDGQHFSTYDIEMDKSYSFNFGQKIDDNTKVRWMDGTRLLVLSNGVNYSVEYDGTNVQKLIPSISYKSLFFDRDYVTMYAFLPAKSDPATLEFNKSDIRYVQDK